MAVSDLHANGAFCFSFVCAGSAFDLGTYAQSADSDLIIFFLLLCIYELLGPVHIPRYFDG